LSDVKYPDVDVRVTKDTENVILRFNKNIGLISMGPEVAIKMAEMIKLEAIKILRS